MFHRFEKVPGSGFWVQRFRVQGSGFRGSGVQGFRGSGFKVQGSRFKVQGSRRSLYTAS